MVKPAEFLEDVFHAGIGGFVCIPTTIWLISADGEKTFNKTAAPGDAPGYAPSYDPADDADKTDRFLPCWVLFLVRTKTIFQFHFCQHYLLRNLVQTRLFFAYALALINSKE